jgi:ABC-2 type transport system permease protein
VFAVTGVNRCASLVADINSGYFDRLLMMPVSGLALLIGTMAADFVLVATITPPVLCLGFILGVEFYNGFLGFLAFIGMAAFWGMVFRGPAARSPSRRRVPRRSPGPRCGSFPLPS